jgi:hypothetical protein
MSSLFGRKTLCGIGALVLMLACGSAPAEPVIGRISATFGDVQIKSTDGTRKAKVADVVHNGDTIITGATDAASVVLDSKVVAKLDANTEMRIVEDRAAAGVAPAKSQDTHLELRKGTTEVFLGKRGLNDGAVALSDTIATIDATGTVFTASFTPDTRNGTYICEESKITVHPAAGGVATVVAANQLARVRDGKLLGIEKLNRQELRSLTGTVQRLGTQTQQHNAKLTQRRSDVKVVRSALATQVKAQTNSTKSAAELEDLLSARCADLDQLAELKLEGKPLPAHSVDGSIRATDGNVLIFFLDRDRADGDKININVRSCTDANLKTVSDLTLKQDPQKISVHVDVPNILEIKLSDLSDGRFGNNTLAAGVASTSTNEVFTQPKATLNLKTNPERTIHILVTK